MCAAGGPACANGTSCSNIRSNMPTALGDLAYEMQTRSDERECHSDLSFRTARKNKGAYPGSLASVGLRNFFTNS